MRSAIIGKLVYKKFGRNSNTPSLEKSSKPCTDKFSNMATLYYIKILTEHAPFAHNTVLSCKRSLLNRNISKKTRNQPYEI